MSFNGFVALLIYCCACAACRRFIASLLRTFEYVRFRLFDPEAHVHEVHTVNFSAG